MGDSELEDPIHLALLLPCYWPEVLRGAERITRELADGLLARGQRPSLITSHRARVRRDVEDGLPVLRLPRPPQGPLARRQPYLTHVPLTYLALRKGSFDIAHALYPTDALAAVRWRRHGGRAAVLSFTGVPYRRWLSADRWQREVLVRAVDGCDAVVVLSHHAAEAMHDSIGRRPEVIEPGVDLTVFRPAPARAERPTIVCTAAVDVARKNVALLIEAFSLVRQRYPSARLVLVRPRDEAAARRAGIDVRAAGVEWIDHDHRAAALARVNGEAWVAVLPAVDEAFGLVLVEALACGTPVVGFAGGGIPEIIDRAEIGRVFERLEPEALAGALIDTLELAQDQRTAASCRGRAEEFSTDAACERYLALYRRLLGGESGRAQLTEHQTAAASQ